MERTRKTTGPKTGDFLRERNASAPASPFPQNANSVRVLKRRSHGADKAKTSPKTGFYCGSGMRSDVVETGGLGPSD